MTDCALAQAIRLVQRAFDEDGTDWHYFAMM